MYDIYSSFNLEEHKKHFVNYLEAIIICGVKPLPSGMGI